MEARQGGGDARPALQGSLVVGVRLGGGGDLEPVGETVDERGRGGVLDEGLEVLTALWSGEPVTHEGPAFRLAGARMLPTPVQQPRIPIWVAGFWPNKSPFRRAARWDGAIPLRRGFLLEGLPPAELHECVNYLRERRADSGPFDVLAFATARPQSPELAAECEAAGATWWIEAVNPLEESLAEFRERLIRGAHRT
jgi:alkanesulfonate monooxygenase SsuD/methylene tetrahydromethanopterin reductase-like flavin-dependent oxidoreductase (luciferase family)